MRFIRIEHCDNGVAVITLDHPERSVNTLFPALIEEIEISVVPLLAEDRVKAMVLASAKQDSFIAGADLDILASMVSVGQAAALSRDGNALLSRLASAAKPVVAAVHGAALGGGLEVALGCHYLLASDHPSTVLALPEVMLGLLPAGGGTQRLVQRIGLIAALPMLLTGKRVRAKKAYRMGLVDALTSPGGITGTAVRAAIALADGRLHRRRRKRSLADRLMVLPPVRSFVLGKARERVERQTRGLYPAPPAILDCVSTGLARGRAEGLQRESEHFGRLVMSPESRSLVWIFQAMNRAKKAPERGARQLQRVAVLGAGFMGAGVASVTLGHHPVVVRDISADALSAAACSVDRGLVKQRRSGAITAVEAERRRSRLLLSTELEAISAADMVVEAVFEDLKLKRRVLAEVEEIVHAEAVFASNTSALPITAIAAEAKHPERVLGMHYFSPVARMPLLELVVAEATADWAVATARALGVQQGKAVVAVKDGPGFFTTRILAPYLNEAVLLLEEGARIEDVDRFMKDFGFPVGPVALIDEVGIDVGAHVARDLGSAFEHRGLGASDALPRLAEAGFGGRKNKRGFYLYPAGKKKKRVNEDVYRLLGAVPRRSVAAVEVQRRLANLMVNEAAHSLAEQVVASPEDADLAAVLGLGFPPFRGGPFHHLDQVGVAGVVAELEELADTRGRRFTPAPLLVDMAKTGKSFYG